MEATQNEKFRNVGANMAFMVVSVLSLIGLIISFFIKNEKAEEDTVPFGGYLVGYLK